MQIIQLISHVATVLQITLVITTLKLFKRFSILRDLKDKDMAKLPIFHFVFFLMDFLAVIVSITLLFMFAICNVPSSPPYVQEDFEALRTGVDFGIVAAALSFISTASIMIKSIVDLRRAWKKKKVVTAKGSFRV